MSKKITRGFTWEKWELQVLKQRAKVGDSARQAQILLNKERKKLSLCARTSASVDNKIRVEGIKFRFQFRGTTNNWTPTKKLAADVKKLFLRGKTKEQVAAIYASDRKIPVRKFRAWLKDFKSRANRNPSKDGITPDVLEDIYTDKLSGMTSKMIALKRKLSLHQVRNNLPAWQVQRQRIMTRIANGEPMGDLMTEFGLSEDLYIDLKKIFRHLDSDNMAEELSPYPIWTPEQEDAAIIEVSRAAKSVRAFDKEKREVDIPIETDLDYICVLISGDWHYESKFTDHGALIKTLNRVRDTPGVLLGFNGDIIDNGINAGPHSDIKSDAVAPIKVARAAARGLFRKVSKKMLWMLIGCHGQWSVKADDYNIYEEIAKQFDIPYLGPGGTVNLKVNGIPYRGGVMHKFRGGGLDLLGPNKKYLREIDALCDFVVVAHNHVNSIGMLNYQRRMRALLRAGSFKDLDTFARLGMYQTQDDDRHPPCLILGTREKKMFVESSLEDGINHMNGLNRMAKEKRDNESRRKKSK